MLEIRIYSQPIETIRNIDKNTIKIEGNALSFKDSTGARRYFNGIPFSIYNDDPEEPRKENNKTNGQTSKVTKS